MQKLKDNFVRQGGLGVGEMGEGGRLHGDGW